MILISDATGENRLQFNDIFLVDSGYYFQHDNRNVPFLALLSCTGRNVSEPSRKLFSCLETNVLAIPHLRTTKLQLKNSTEACSFLRMSLKNINKSPGRHHLKAGASTLNY